MQTSTSKQKPMTLPLKTLLLNKQTYTHDIRHNHSNYIVQTSFLCKFNLLNNVAETFKNQRK